MNRTFNRKIVIALAAAATISSLSLNAAMGAGKLVSIQADLNDTITIMLHGKKFVAKEDDGTVLTPITYKGRTYLPMRAVAEASGLKVKWDPNTKTAYLGDQEGSVDIDRIEYTSVTQEFSFDDHRFRTKDRSASELTTAGGETFDYGYVTGQGNYSVDIMVKLDYKYSNFKAKIYVDSDLPEHLSKDGTGTIEITDENKLPIKTFTAKKGEIFEVSLDRLTTVKQLRISVQGDRSVIGEPMIGKP